MNKVESRKLKRLRGRLELGPPVGFYADRFFFFQVGNKSKLIPSQKIKKRVKYTTIRALQAKAFENISFYDQCRPVHSAREVIKIKLALFMAQSIPLPHLLLKMAWVSCIFTSLS